MSRPMLFDSSTSFVFAVRPSFQPGVRYVARHCVRAHLPAPSSSLSHSLLICFLFSCHIFSNFSLLLYKSSSYCTLYRVLIVWTSFSLYFMILALSLSVSLFFSRSVLSLSVSFFCLSPSLSVHLLSFCLCLFSVCMSVSVSHCCSLTISSFLSHLLTD